MVSIPYREMQLSFMQRARWTTEHHIGAYMTTSGRALHFAPSSQFTVDILIIMDYQRIFSVHFSIILISRIEI